MPIDVSNMQARQITRILTDTPTKFSLNSFFRNKIKLSFKKSCCAHLTDIFLHIYDFRLLAF